MAAAREGREHSHIFFSDTNYSCGPVAARIIGRIYFAIQINYPVRKIDLSNFQRATSGTAREINRRIALSFIRRHSPLSRADLARSSGLQPSTVSAIIDELIGEGWVTEGIGRAPRGRRPRLLHLNVERAGIIAVDLRPETTTVGLAGIDARFVDQVSWRTPQDPEAWVDAVTRTVRGFRSAHPRVLCEGVGVSLPGRADEEGRLIFAPNLRWGHVNIRTLLEQRLELPAAVENAANACALAELWFGRHAEHVRNLDRRHDFRRHRRRPADERTAGAGRRRARRRIRPRHAGRERPALPVRQARLLGALRVELGGARHLSGLGGRGGVEGAAFHVRATRARLAHEGDRHAVTAIDSMATHLAMGLAGLITGLSPEIVVIIGEITAAWDRVGPIVADVVKRRALPPLATRVVPADVAIQPRLRGAATLVVQQHFGAPVGGVR